MLTTEEQRKLKLILELMNERKEEKKIDVSHRARDERGRFQSERKEEESKFESGRKIKLVRVKGSYGTYLVKEAWFDEKVIGVISLLGVITLLTVIF